MIHKAFVYRITNTVNGKIYIGKTCNKNPSNRWLRHLAVAKSRRTDNNTYQILHKAINRYGKENFLFEIIEECASNDLGCEREIFWIAHYKSNVHQYGKKFGYNLTAGGDGSLGFRHSQKSKDLMSQSRKGTRLGEENTFYGKHHTEEAKQKIRLGAVGRKCSPKEIESRSKLKVADVLNIRAECSGPFTKKELVIKKNELALQYGITMYSIHLILKRERWAQI